MFFHFPLSRNSMQKWYLQRDCVTSHEKLSVYLFFSRINFQKVLYPPVILFACFFSRKYHPHLLSFSLIVMAFPACTCELVHIQDSFEFLWVVSGLGVQVWLKRYLRAATRVSMFSPFSLFVFLFSSLHYHTCMFFLFPWRVPSDLEVKVNIDQNRNLFYHYLFQRTPVIYNFNSQENVFLFVIYFHQNMKLSPDKFF